jgi:predicted DNA-binding ribbon-helix-helix protein
MSREAVFLAADIREADSVERVLDEAGVDYSLRLEAVPREGGACYQGILYEVASDRAMECRRLILDRGLSRGVMFPGHS